MSHQHLDRCMQELAGRHNLYEPDAFDQMGYLAKAMRAKQLKYADLLADNGQPNGTSRS